MDSKNRSDVAQAIQQHIMRMTGFAKVSHNCFMKCVTRPGKSLSYTESNCISNCVDRFNDTKNFLALRLQEKAEQEASKMGSH